MSIQSLATTTATIQRKTTTASALGGHVNTYATAYSDVSGTLQPLGGDRRERFHRLGVEVDHVFYTATSVATQAGDRLLIGSTYYAVNHSEDMGGRARAFAIYVKQTD